MKKSLLLSMFALGVWTSAGAFEADLDGTKFNIDTVYSYIVGPGVEQTKYTLNNGSTRSFNIYTSTLTRSKGAEKGVVEPYIVIGKDQCSGGEQLTSMAQRHSQGDTQLLTGINGDFFITSANSANFYGGQFVAGYPHMTCVIDRKMAAPNYFDPGNHLATLITTADNWYIDGTDVSYTIYSEDLSSSISPAQFNYPHRDHEFMLYNSYMGKTTASTNGKELLLRLDSEYDWKINEKLKFHVEGAWTEDVNISIPEDCIVFSCGPDYDTTALDKIIDTGTVYVQFGITLPNHDKLTPDIVNIVGGDVRILNQGEITREALRWINTPTSAYQRALVGFSQNRDMMVFAAVDGSGLTYFECAAFMRELGCYDALDLDGGGSTAIWSDCFGVYNNPRDGSNLRAIANGLFFSLKAPDDNVVTSIRFADYKKEMPIYGKYAPVIYGYNQYGQLIDTDVKGFRLTAPNHFGTTSEDGTVAYAGPWAGTYKLIATLGDMTATVDVTLSDSNPIELRHSSLLIDNYHPVEIELFSLVDNEEMLVDANAFAWTSDNETVATVKSGIIQGQSDGTARITGTLGEQVLTIDITVECPTSNLYDLAGNDPEAWKTSGTGTSVTSLTIGEDNSMSVDFKITNARGPKLVMRRDIVLWSRPDAIEVVLNPGDLTISSAAVALVPQGEKSLSATIETIEANKDNVLTFPISDFTDADNPGIYPLTLRSLTFGISMPKGEGYHFDIKSINAVYNSYEAGVSDISVDTTPLKPIIVDNQIAIGYEAALITLHDMTGRTVATATNTTTLPTPTPGIYILTTHTPTKTQSTKLIIR